MEPWVRLQYQRLTERLEPILQDRRNLSEEEYSDLMNLAAVVAARYPELGAWHVLNIAMAETQDLLDSRALGGK
jgi:hypothetical protein